MSDKAFPRPPTALDRLKEFHTGQLPPDVDPRAGEAGHHPGLEGEVKARRRAQARQALIDALREKAPEPGPTDKWL
jgi:hypothetical protein